MRNILLLIIFLFNGWLTTQAQVVSFSASSPTINCGDNSVTVHITTDNFTDITSVNFSVEWDETVLTFSSVSNFNTSIGINNNNFNTSTEIDNGALGFVWFAGFNQTLSPDERLFSITFVPTGMGTSSSIDFTDGPPTNINITGDNGNTNITNAGFNSGTVTISATGDTEDPVISNCPDDIMITAAAGASSAPATWVAPTATDNCLVVLNSTHNSGDSFPIGTSTVTYTATDGSGNSATCSFDVIVEESAQPAGDLTFTMSSPFVQCEASSVILDVTVDNFIDITSANFTIEWNETILQFVGLSNQAALGLNANNFNVTTAPNGALGFSWFSGSNTTLNDGTIIFSIEFSLVGNTTFVPVNFTNGPPTSIGATADNGNTQLTPEFNNGGVTILNTSDNEDPVISNCPQDITQQIPQGATGGPVNWVAPTATDNCAVTLTSTHNPGDNFPLGTTTVTYTATDSNNNMVTCSFDVTVENEDGPANNVSFIASSEVIPCGANVIIDITTADFFNITSTNFTVEWDETVLTFVQLSNFNSTLGLSGNNFNIDPAVVSMGALGFSWFSGTNTSLADNDILFSIEFSTTGTGNSSNIIFTNGPPTTINVTANNGVDQVIPNLNAGSVTIDQNQDNIDPVISNCPADITVLVPSGANSSDVDWIEPNANDNCNLVAFTGTHNPGDNFPLGTTGVTYTATDGQGNMSQCMFNVTVQVNGNNNTLTFNTSSINAICGQTTVSIDITTENFIDITSANFSVAWDENVLSFNQISNMNSTLGLSSNNFNTDSQWVTMGALGFSWFTFSGVNLPDNAILFTIEFTISNQNSSAISFFDGPPTPIGATANNGNTQIDPILNGGMFTFDNTDNVPPFISNCPDDITVSAGEGICTQTATWDEPTVSDICDAMPSLSSSHNSGDSFAVGTTTVTYTAMDASNNTATCNFTVTVTDNEAPNLVDCPTDISLDVDANTCEAIATWDEPTVSDICDAMPSLSSSHNSGDSFAAGTTTVTYTATDASNNTATCNFTVTVTDNEAPNLVDCPIDISLDADANTCEAIAIWDEPTGSDICDAMPSLSSSHNSGDSFAVGTTTVTYTATDASNNTATCNFTVTVSANGGIMIVCPDDTSITCIQDASDTGLTGTATATNDCGGNSPMITFTDDNNTNDCGVGIITRTWRATNGNEEVTCPQVITITEVPIDASCQNISVQLDENGTASITGAELNNNSTGGCGTLTFSANPNTFSCDELGDNVVTLTATDDCENTATCTSTVTVTPNEGGGGGALMITCPPDISINCNQTPDEATTGTATATNDCGGNSPMITFTDDNNTNDCGVGIITRTWRATNGNEEVTCPQVIMITEVPINAACQDITVQLAENGEATITAEEISTSTGGCGTLSLSIDRATFNCNDIGANTVTLTVTDDCGNTETCTSTVVVKANEGITLTCPAPLTVNCGDNISPIETGTATAIDACNNVIDNISFADNPEGGATCPGIITRTWTAVDDSDNTTSCEQIITVETIEIVPVCQDITVGLDDNGMASIMATQLNGGSSGGCGVLTPTADTTTFDASDLGANNVTLTLTDECGGTATCIAVVTVTDQEVPMIQCPMPVVTAADLDSCNALVSNLELIVTSDPDQIASIVYTLTGDTEGTGNGDASGFYNVGVTSVTYTANGTNGQSSTCTFSVTVNDEQAPVFSDCPDDISLSLQAGSCDTLVSWTEPTVTENCSIDMISKSHEPGDMFMAGTTNVTYVAVDEAGNTDTCSFNIIITEPTPPTITCPENITIAADLNTCSTVVNWEEPVAMDNCGTATVVSSHESGTDFSVGTTTVTYTATDISNNTTTCTFDVTVNDEQAPSFDNCPEDLMLEIVTAGRCDTMINWEIPSISDNCPEPVILTTSHQPNGTFPVGTTMVEYIATDEAGNADTCRFNIIITGNTIQNDFCPPSNSLPTMEGVCEAIATWDEPNFRSDCSSLSVESSHQSGDIFLVGTTTVEYVAIDTFGNSDTCRFDITVRDIEAPTIEGCPTDTIISSASGSCSINYFWTIPTIIDNCDVLAVEATHSPGDAFELGEAEVVYSVIDVNGNATSCSFTVTVRDMTGPAINCPEPIEVGIDGVIISDPSTFITNTTSNDCNSVNLEFDTPTATDDCSSVTITQTDMTGLMSGSIFPIGINTLTYTAVDTFGNETTCDVLITVQSFEAIIPEITNTEPCEGEFVKFSISQDDEVDGGVYTWTGPDGEEYDGTVLSIEMVGLEDSGTWTVTIVDMNGCTSSGTFEIIVHPTPDVVASASNTFFCGVGDESLQLMAEDIANAGVVEWCWQTPNRGVICEQNPLISNLVSEDAGMYIVTGATDAGCMDFDTVIVNIPGVDGPILPTLVATPDELCVDDINNTTTLIGTSYFGDNIEYHWSASPSDNAGIDDTNANVNTATPTAVGDYTYQYWVTDSGCSTDTAEVLVHVEQAAPIEIQLEGETDCVNGQGTIILTAITDLEIANTSSITCTWMYPDGSTASPGDVLELPNATSAQSGSYTVICRTVVGCESSNTIVLDVTDATITPDLNMEDDLICVGETFNLNVLTEYDPTANYQWTAEPMEGSGLPGIATPSSLVVTPTESGTYTYSLVVTVGGCTSIAGQVSGTVVGSPTASLATMPTSLECVEFGTSLTLVESSGTATTWTWETPRGTFTGNNIVLENITATDSGIYSVTVSNEAGCSSETVTTMIIITGALAAPSIKGPESICEGDDISGDMLCIAEPVLGATYSWTGPNGALGATGPCLTINNVTPFNSGTYTVVCELSGCSSPVSETFDLVVLDAPMLANDELPAFVGLSTVFDATDNDDLHTDNFTVEIIVKTSKGTLINEGDGSFTYTPNDGEFGVDNFVYEICYTDCPDNCDMATVALDIQFPNDECKPTTVVSPNGDGKNDRFIITCLTSDLYPNNSLVIYNRWGDQVYQAAPYFNDWDARYEGETLPDGTYYFIFMREPNDPDPIKSFITVHK